jgi:hypothetical protein
MTTERQVRVADLQVGDYIKSFVDFIPPMRVSRAPLPRQYGMVDWVDTQGTKYGDGANIVTVLDIVPPEPGWGERYSGPCPAYQSPEGPVWMFRKGQRVCFYNDDGLQVGPEQSNVAPAVAYAISHGWLLFAY